MVGKSPRDVRRRFNSTITSRGQLQTNVKAKGTTTQRGAGFKTPSRESGQRSSSKFGKSTGVGGVDQRNTTRTSRRRQRQDVFARAGM